VPSGTIDQIDLVSAQNRFKALTNVGRAPKAAPNAKKDAQMLL
jgi:hypothetical protein